MLEVIVGATIMLVGLFFGAALMHTKTAKVGVVVNDKNDEEVLD